MTANAPERERAPAGEADAWFTPGRFALVLGGLIAVTFGKVLAGSETFFFRDFGVFGYPLAQYHRDCFWRGEMPLWNPYNFCGLPFLAQWNTLTLYPPSLFYLIFPLSWSLGVFNLAHMFWAGLGMYFLARRWTGSQIAASAAGLLFAFNGLTWHALMWPNDIAGLSWMPWVVLAAERAWAEGGRRIAVAALAGALQMLAGAPEIILLTWVCVGALWLAGFFRVGVGPKLLLGRFIAVMALVAGLASAQLLPFLDLLKHSHRDTGFGSGLGWAMPLSGLGNFFAPLFHCYPASQGIFVQYDQYWIPSYYLGAGAMLLAAAAAWRATNRKVWLLLALAIGGIWMALGGHGYLYSTLLRLAPALGFMRYPIKFVVLAVFLIPVLAAYGLQRVEAGVDDKINRNKFLLGGAVVLVCVLGLLAFLEWKFPGIADNQAATWKNILLRGAFVIAIAATLIAMRSPVDFRLHLVLRVALLLLLWMDVLTHAPNLTPTVARGVYEPGLMRAEFKLPPQGNAGGARFMETSRDMEKVHFKSLTNAVNDYLCRRLALFDDCNLLDNIPKIDGFYSLYLKETMATLSVLYTADNTNIDLPGLKDFMGIGYVSASTSTNDAGLDWLPRKTSMPIITAGQKPAFAPPEQILAVMADARFNPRENVYLPADAQPFVHANRADAKISAQEIGTQRLSFQVDASAPAMVVIAQSWYAPWRASVDRKPVPLWRANYAFQALEVPAGHHEVRVVYRDRVFAIGVVISLTCLALAGAIWLWAGSGERPTVSRSVS